MKGVFWVVMMLGLLVSSYLVVKNVSTPETLNGSGTGLEAIDRAKESADLLNRKAQQVEKMLRHPADQ
ncbi:MAG: hypothetical protein R3231_01070 [bacterium]|nr:hypothetical protein [bacterium]